MKIAIIVLLLIPSVAFAETIDNEDFYKIIGKEPQVEEPKQQPEQSNQSQELSQSKYPNTVTKTDSMGTTKYTLDNPSCDISTMKPISQGNNIYSYAAAIESEYDSNSLDDLIKVRYVHRREYKYVGIEGNSIKIMHSYSIKAFSDDYKPRDVVNNEEELFLPINDKKQALLRAEGEDEGNVYYVPKRDVLITLVDDFGGLAAGEYKP